MNTEYQKTLIKIEFYKEKCKELDKFPTDLKESESIKSLIDFCGGVYYMYKKRLSDYNEFCADGSLKRYYTYKINNDPQIHCNRFPSWEELNTDQKFDWYLKYSEHKK